MKAAFYPKLAAEGIRKNKRLYIPYLMTGTVMVMMSYILLFLSESEALKNIKGGTILRTILPFGCAVILAFSLIFMFYSNSFLLRQRNREFGLYNILGMNKGNLARIMVWENLFAAVISIGCGLVLGMALSKFAELGMLNLLNGQVDYTLRLDFASAAVTALEFIAIFALLLLNSVIRVRRSNPLELLHSASVGEKPPKANWIFAFAGVIILALAYYLAITIEQPLDAMTLFFVAVIMVIIATYLLFISGSVVLCRMLQRNRNYYYKPNHFVSVSSMVYRMKRNGAGLASICILITMVLVMLSSTLSLYIGAEDAIVARYPSDIGLRLVIPEVEYFNDGNFSFFRGEVDARAENIQNPTEHSGISIAGLLRDDGMLVDYQAHSDLAATEYENVGYLNIISLEDYNNLMGTNETLAPDECLIYGYRTEYSGDTFTVEGCETLRVKSVLGEMYVSGYDAMRILPSVTLIAADPVGLIQPLLSVENMFGNSVLQFYWSYNFDVGGGSEARTAVFERLQSEIGDFAIKGSDGDFMFDLDSREEGRESFYGLYGGLLLIGILLSIVFVFAAVLIIYYKQISEGFEDQKRFEVMQKVGMTRRDIRKSINSQVLTVFFLPLIVAGLHLAAAFPMVWRLMLMFNLSNVTLMIIVTAASFVVFAAAYAVVYKITSNAYFAIVSEGRQHA